MQSKRPAAACGAVAWPDPMKETVLNPLEKRTLPAILRRSVAEFGDRPATTWVGGEAITYREFGRRVGLLARGLSGLGVRPGDRVALLSENRPDWGIAHFAITTLGAVAVPILPDFHADEIRTILEHSGARVLFVSQKQCVKLAGMEAGLCPVRIRMEGFVPIPEGATADGIETLDEAASLERAAPPPATAGDAAHEAEETDTAAVIYTSGTTGHSKGVELTHLNFTFDVLATLQIQHADDTDRFLSVLPLSHAYEFTIGFLIPFTVGACVYYLDKPPVARVLIPALETVRPTLMLTVPLIIEKVYRSKVAPKLSGNAVMRFVMKAPFLRRTLYRAAAGKVYKSFGGRLHFFGIGGAKLAADVERFLREGKFPYAIGYGLTETSPLIAGCTPRVTRFRSTGPPIPGVEVRIANPDPATGEGEIQVKGPTVMKGYYRDPERTREVLTADGWFRTGDLGIQDKDGYLYIRGRAKNTIIGPSGENIYPEEIESVLNRYEEVLESLVYEEEGKLVARVHPNYEALHKYMKTHGLTQTQISHAVHERLEALRHRANSSVSKFSRITKIVEQPHPFEKTPTQKIKRYLYTGKGKTEKKD
jgi:long-chain acyl-CoA synthetase